MLIVFTDNHDGFVGVWQHDRAFVLAAPPRRMSDVAGGTLHNNPRLRGKVGSREVGIRFNRALWGVDLHRFFLVDDLRGEVVNVSL